jgi:serpin B
MLSLLATVSLLLIQTSFSLPTDSSKLISNSKSIERSNELGLNLLHTLSNDDNTLLSPISLTSTLLTLVNGANGDTKQELRQMLNIDDKTKLEDINNEMKALIDLIAKKDNLDDLSLKLKNKILVSNESPVLETYKKTIEDNYKTDVVSVDFATNVKNATKDLNQWVYKETNGEIQKLFKDSLDSQSSVVSTSAAVFHGSWKHPFDSSATKRGEFMNGEEFLNSTIDFVTALGKYRVQSVPQIEAQLIEIPYKADSLSMFILLPDNPRGLNEVSDKLTLEILNEGIAQLMKKEGSDISLTIPKLKLESDYDLKEPIEEYEVKTLFHDSADLSGINGQKNLRVSTAIHKATVTFYNDVSVGSDPCLETSEKCKNPTTINVNRPFVFLVRDNSNGLILFIGRVQTLINENILSRGFI